MNMGATSLTREQLNEAINEFADKIIEALGATVADEEPGEPELTGTHFKAINLAGDEVKLDAEQIPPGTLVIADVYEYFRCYAGEVVGPWVKYTGMLLTHEEFAEEMRESPSMPRIVHWG